MFLLALGDLFILVLTGLFRLKRATCFSRLRPAGIGGTGVAYPAALVDWVPEAKSVAARVFCQAVVAFRP